MKKLKITIFLLFIVCGIISAAGSNEAVGVLLPRESINNSNYAFLLPLAETPLSSVETPDVGFTSFCTKGNELFRIRTSLTEEINVNITPGPNGWNFVHENNSTILRPYEIDYVHHVMTATSGANYETTSTSAPATFNTVTGLTLDSTTFTVWPISSFADNINDYDFVIRFKDTVSILESGYYNTSFTVTTDSVKIPTTVVYLRGYYNVNHSNETEESSLQSFIVTPTDFASAMDLTDSPTDKYYNVGTVRMNANELVDSDPSDDSSLEERYTIYISATPNISTYGEYNLIRLGSENVTRTTANTVSYEIVPVENYTFNSPPPESLLNGAAEVGEYSLNESTKYIIPEYNVVQTASGGFVSDSEWYIEWLMDFPFYVKIPKNQGTHGSGIYQANIYFTLKVN